MEYLLDTNALIDGNNKWYRRDVFPSLWIFFASQSNVHMLKQVFEELLILMISVCGSKLLTQVA
ncbi:DUF4411 family protein [Companilactobacillus furfuricola]|uniref:DUF4411 family protein n=1 Tax=Companilactobacillus furfuricola TaxID=1462575 RepID=UPI000F79AE0E